MPAIHAVITQAISALSESDREHLLSSLTTIRAGPTAVEVSTVNNLTGRIHHIPPPDSENSAVSRQRVKPVWPWALDGKGRRLRVRWRVHWRC